MITNVEAREILDSRGNPTVEVKLTIDEKYQGVAGIPSGASTGEHEALELRDGGERYNGKGVLKAVNNVLNVIKPQILNKEFKDQKELDYFLIGLDGTENKTNLGANAILGVSIAYVKACALREGKEVYEYLGGSKHMPYTMMNILNGGMHADNALLFQEFMIITNRDTMKERVRVSSEVFHSLKSILKSHNFSTNVGDEGGFAPNVQNEEEALDYIIEAIKKAGYVPGKDVNIALDVAASSFYDKEKGKYMYYDQELTSEDMIKMYEKLVEKYPIVSIEDPLDENDWEGFNLITSKLCGKITLIGDDLFVTNKKLLQKGIDNKCCNGILIKLNQIGTVTETLETIHLAQANNYKIAVSHRSGETMDTFISDLAVAVNADYIKAGSMSRGERVAKYNRLMEIEG